MSSLQDDYNERKNEVKSYLNFIRRVGQLDVANPIKVESDQQNILYANTYLLLYNLIESTIARCCRELDQEFSRYTVADIHHYPENVRETWLKSVSKYTTLNAEKRLKGVKTLYEKLSNPQSLLKLSFEFNEDGNLDSHKIKKILNRFGIDFNLPGCLENKIQYHCYDQMGIMQTIKHLRNELAHGKKSFTECGKIFSINEINEYADIIFLYLEFVIAKIERFILKFHLSMQHDYKI
jgi:hypothetical protein